MKKRILLLLMVLCLGAAGGLVVGIVRHQNSSETQQQDVEQLRDQLKVYRDAEVSWETVETEIPPADEPAIAETEEIIPAETEEPEETETIPPETEPQTETVPEETTARPEETETKASVQHPEASLDFSSMWKTNPDICAWIEIDGTKVDYPILQSADNDEKYLTTAVDGSYYIGGSLFTQATYNARDFNDPVTLIYGHTMKSGTLFGQLQSVYSDAASFDAHSEIKLYLPDTVRYYTVFAAVPYDSIHILHTYDFTNAYWYRNFFKGVSKIRSFGANFNRDITPEPGDRVIILSTCLNEDSTKRYLIMAILQEDAAEINSTNS